MYWWNSGTASSYDTAKPQQLKLYVRYEVHSIETSLMMITVSVDMV